MIFSISGTGKERKGKARKGKERGSFSSLHIDIRLRLGEFNRLKEGSGVRIAKILLREISMMWPCEWVWAGFFI